MSHNQYLNNIAWRDKRSPKKGRCMKWHWKCQIYIWCHPKINMLLRCLKWKSTAGLASFLWKPNCTRSEKTKDRQHYPLHVKCNKILYLCQSADINHNCNKFSHLICYYLIREFMRYPRAVVGQFHLHVFPILRILKTSARQNVTLLYISTLFSYVLL